MIPKNIEHLINILASSSSSSSSCTSTSSCSSCSSLQSPFTHTKKTNKNGFNPLLFFLFQFDFNWKTVENNSNSFISGGKKICLKVSFKTHKKKESQNEPTLLQVYQPWWLNKQTDRTDNRTRFCWLEPGRF